MTLQSNIFTFYTFWTKKMTLHAVEHFQKPSEVIRKWLGIVFLTFELMLDATAPCAAVVWQASNSVGWIQWCSKDPTVWHGSNGVAWIQLCGVDPMVWRGSNGVGWIQRCVMDPTVWHGSNGVEWIQRCGVNPTVWSGSNGVA
jgi:hypothetical protein